MHILRTTPKRYPNNLARAMQSERQYAGPDAAAGVADHVLVAPGATGQVAAALTTDIDWASRWQAKLTAMGVTREVEAVSYGGQIGSTG